MTKNVRKKCHLLAQKPFAAANRHVRKDDPINNLLSGPHPPCQDRICHVLELQRLRRKPNLANIVDAFLAENGRYLKYSIYLLCMVGCNWQYWVFAKLSSAIGQRWAGLGYFCALTYLDKCNAATRVFFCFCWRGGGLFIEYLQAARVSWGLKIHNNKALSWQI